MANRAWRTHKKLFIACISGLVIAVSLVLPAYAADYNLNQTIIDPNAPSDACPNIGGFQAAIPEGMQLNSSGNCYTPEPSSPPTPPITTDLCTNLAQTQFTLPNGYYRTSEGLCYEQPAAPAEPVDVCSNLEDIQVTIPDGYYLNTDNTCRELPAPKDVCLNIDGPQAEVPDGMVVENNICYTPEQTTSIANVPPSLTGYVQPLIDLVPSSVKTWLRSLPPIVAQTASYYIIALIALLVIGIILQSIREAEFARQLIVLLKRRRALAEQKDAFIALASHYLRTPLTLMQSGVDTIIAGNELSEETVAPLRRPLEKLKSDIAQILETIQNNTALHAIEAPQLDNSRLPSVWRSALFWGPFVGSLLLLLLANFLFGVVGNQEIGTSNATAQSILFITLLVVLYLTVRSLYAKQQLHKEQLSLVAHEETIDQARNTFIVQTTAALKTNLTAIDTGRRAVVEAPSANYINNGFERLQSLLERFLLLASIETHTRAKQKELSLKRIVDDSLDRHHDALLAKEITVTNTVEKLTIKQDPKLFGFVIDSLVDNAIKFNKQGGSISIGAALDGTTLKITVSDDGIGIEQSKLEQLFQPFTRATSTMEFDYEGIGFSLFLDRIIMDYTDGSIDASSEPDHGTHLTVSSPH